MDKSVQEIYGNRVRTRVCGICWQGDTILMVNHFGLYNHDFWAPPGGGVEFGQSAPHNLIREFKEETDLAIEVGEFLFACELIQSPLHAIELFFEVTVTGGTLFTGIDPEMDGASQIIKNVKYLSESEINALPEGHKHGIFKLANSIKSIRAMRGYLRI